MASHRFTHVACLLLPFAAGCVLVEPVDPNPDAQLRTEQRAHAERVARALCAGYYGCECEDPYPEHRTEAECFDLVFDGLYGRLEQGLDRGLDYNSDCLDAHADLIEALGCTPSSEIVLDLELWQLSDRADRCHTYHGSTDLGAECEALPSARGDDCEPGLACSEFATCEANEALAEGAPCSDDLGRCAAGLSCVGEWLADQGTCTRLPAIGESCEASFGECGFDGWCDSDFVCRPWATPGQACEGGGNVLDTCGGYEAHCDAGTCLAASGLGEPCGLGCALGLRCGDDELCVRNRAAVCDMRETLP